MSDTCPHCERMRRLLRAAEQRIQALESKLPRADQEQQPQMAPPTSRFMDELRRRTKSGVPESAEDAS